MTRDQHEIRRKLRILEHADKIGDVNKTCWWFEFAGASLDRWRKTKAYEGEVGRVPAKAVPHNHPQKTPSGVVKKVLHLRSTQHLGPTRIT